MGKATLVVMAAGIGSRFGGGIKQLEPVGPKGEIIIDYSIFDAMQAGFDKVVFVIRKDLEKDFKEVIGSRIEKRVKVEYAYQETNGIPEKYKDKFRDRTKPWGTGQAILCCEKLIKEPFLVINADDYYGREAYKKAYDNLLQIKVGEKKLHICMVGFVLGNTLSDNGGVTRGVCQVNENRLLTNIVETHNIVKDGNKAVVQDGMRRIPVDVKAEVSMNMWGLTPEIFPILDKGFGEFLEKIESGDTKSEYLLPTIIGDLLKQDIAEVEVLQSKDRWFGVTYKEDKKTVMNAIQELIADGIYR